jgi:type I restriction enzyme S subunit
MSKQKSGLVPRLRFPEFREAGEWNCFPLSQISQRLTEKVGSRKLLTVSITAGLGFVSQSEKFGRDISGHQYKNYIRLKRGQFSYNKGNSKRFPQGCIYQLTEFDEVAAPSAFISFKFIDDFVPEFFRGYFESNFHGYQLLKFITSGARSDGLLNISADDFFSIKLPTPKKREEQRKIAACLSSLDALIAAQADKLDALKTHKKGLMQQLFPREGETVPRLRFPEFREAGEWEERRLEQISDAIFDGTHQTPAYTEEGVPFFSVENIVSGKENKFISREDYLIATSRNKPEKGDILITRIGKIGFSAVVDWEYDFSVYVTLAVIKKSEAFDSHFLNGFFQSERYQNEILGKSLLTAVPCKINMDELRKTRVLLPSFPEQRKIAACLSSLDALIAAQADKLDALKTHKKGLMQQLFPSPEAIHA